jgi:hypothetical protein
MHAYVAQEGKANHAGAAEICRYDNFSICNAQCVGTCPIIEAEELLPPKNEPEDRIRSCGWLRT